MYAVYPFALFVRFFLGCFSTTRRLFYGFYELLFVFTYVIFSAVDL